MCFNKTPVKTNKKVQSVHPVQLVPSKARHGQSVCLSIMENALALGQAPYNTGSRVHLLMGLSLAGGTRGAFVALPNYYLPKLTNMT